MRRAPSAKLYIATFENIEIFLTLAPPPPKSEKIDRRPCPPVVGRGLCRQGLSGQMNYLCAGFDFRRRKLGKIVVRFLAYVDNVCIPLQVGGHGDPEIFDSS